MPSLTPILYQGLQVVLMSKVALMQQHLSQLRQGMIWPLMCNGISFPIAGAKLQLVSPGEVALGHTTTSNGLMANHSTAYELGSSPRSKAC